jgi:hypothetical protein
MAPSGPTASHFQPRFPAQIPEREAALMCRTHLSERCGWTCRFMSASSPQA